MVYLVVEIPSAPLGTLMSRCDAITLGLCLDMGINSAAQLDAKRVVLCRRGSCDLENAPHFAAPPTDAAPIGEAPITNGFAAGLGLRAISAPLCPDPRSIRPALGKALGAGGRNGLARFRFDERRIAFDAGHLRPALSETRRALNGTVSRPNLFLAVAGNHVRIKRGVLGRCALVLVLFAVFSIGFNACFTDRCPTFLRKRRSELPERSYIESRLSGLPLPLIEGEAVSRSIELAALREIRHRHPQGLAGYATHVLRHAVKSAFGSGMGEMRVRLQENCEVMQFQVGEQFIGMAVHRGSFQ
nr:hypothetical protein SHINE37_44152 [Rhizobiaceae bacterium]